MKNNRRGLSSIIGSMFVVMLTASALAATILVLEQQERATTEMTQETGKYLDGLSEKVEISNTKINNDKLNLTLSNAGDSVAHVKSIYIVNETASPEEQYRYDIDYLIDGSAAVTNVGQALPFVASNTTSYTIRIVTESGNSASSVYHSTSGILPLSLSVIPPAVTTGENVTLLYTITNNLANSEPLHVAPIISNTVTCDVTQACTATKLISGSKEVVIERNSFAVIKETYRIEGPPGTIATFNATFTGAANSNYVIEDAKVIVVTSALSTNTGKATEPDIYLIIPGPFGESNQHGLWGVVIVNPTNSTMEISRVMVTAFTAAHRSDVVMETGCDDTAIFPADEGEWDCPHDNQIQWKDLSSPEIIQPGKSISFLVRVEPDELGDNPAQGWVESIEPGATVTATVYTDIGIFTKAGYTTSMVHKAEYDRECQWWGCFWERVDIAYGPLGSVYLTNTASTGTSGALNNNNMLGHLNSIAPGTNTTFYVAMADLDTGEIDDGTESRINSGSKLIINVPPGFSNVNVISHSKFLEPTINIRADGITQIVGVTNEHIGNSGQESAVIAFSAITPSPSQDSTYLMFALINGVTNTDPQMVAGAVAEIALQVDGTS